MFLCATDFDKDEIKWDYDICDIRGKKNHNKNVFNNTILGNFLRITIRNSPAAFKSYFEFTSAIQSRHGFYILKMFTVINCEDPSCEAAKHAIAVLIKDGGDGAFTEVCSVSDRLLDEKWYELENCIFLITEQEFWVHKL